MKPRISDTRLHSETPSAIDDDSASAMNGEARDKASRTSFDRIWSGIIGPQMRTIEDRAQRQIFLPENVAKRRVGDAYQAFRSHVKRHYMKYPDSTIDRHKVAACYMLAIERAELAPDVYGDEPPVCYANERLATTTGCSVLVSFLVTAMDEITKEALMASGTDDADGAHGKDGDADDAQSSESDRACHSGVDGMDDGEVDGANEVEGGGEPDFALTDAWQDQRKRLITEGIRFPPCAHDDYLVTFYQSLYYMRIEESYAVLLLANLLFCWETMTLEPRVCSRLRDFYKKFNRL